MFAVVMKPLDDSGVVCVQITSERIYLPFTCYLLLLQPLGRLEVLVWTYILLNDSHQICCETIKDSKVNHFRVYQHNRHNKVPFRL